MAFLGIDVGSSSVKASVIDHDGRTLGFAMTDVGNMLRRPAPSWAERDSEALWDAVCITLSKLTEVGRVQSVSVDATSGSVVAVDRYQKPLSSILLYSDKRAEDEAKYILETSTAAREYEAYLPLDPYLVLPKILWMRSHLAEFGKIEQ